MKGCSPSAGVVWASRRLVTSRYPSPKGALRAPGFEARRLEDGMPEWRLAGLPVATGME